jgi:hypothetical protein
MPPVDAASWEIRPFVTVSSSSRRKDAARSCLICVNAFFDSRTEVAFTLGAGVGLAGLALAGSGKSCFRGECSSFQSSMNSWSQNMSVLGRWGVVGMRDSFFGETRPGLVLGGVEGGVRSSSFCLAEKSVGGGRAKSFLESWLATFVPCHLPDSHELTVLDQKRCQRGPSPPLVSSRSSRLQLDLCSHVSTSDERDHRCSGHCPLSLLHLLRPLTVMGFWL